MDLSYHLCWYSPSLSYHTSQLDNYNSLLIGFSYFHSCYLRSILPKAVRVWLKICHSFALTTPMILLVNQNEIQNPHRDLIRPNASVPTPHPSNLIFCACSLHSDHISFCCCPRSFAPAFPSAWNAFSQNNGKAFAPSLHLGPHANVSVSERTSQILLLKIAPIPSITLLSFSISLFCFTFLLTSWKNIYLYVTSLASFPWLESKLH